MARTVDLLLTSPASFSPQGPLSDQLGPMLYAELKALAARAMRGERKGHTLQTTALVHEAWLRLAGQHQWGAIERDQLLGLAARMMRRVLVDHARRRLAAKRVDPDPEPAAPFVEWDAATAVAGVGAGADIVALDQALVRLESISPRQAQVVDLKFFAGLELEQIAAVLGIARPTVVRDWRMARAWLERELSHA